MKRSRPISFAGLSDGRSSIEHAPGEVLAGCTVIRKAADGGTLTRFVVTASCGHESTRTGVDLRKADRDGKEIVCNDCLPKLKTKALKARADQSSPLTAKEQNARTAARRKELTPGNRGKGSRICKRCASLPHRVVCCDGPNCFKCGLAYAPEEPVKVDVDARRSA